jgi:ribose transport system permease protein
MRGGMSLRMRGATMLPLLLLAGTVVAATLAVVLTGREVRTNTLYSVLQYFATVGPVALGLGLAMIAGQFDLSVGAMFGLAGIVAVLAGGSSWELGILAACGAGVLAGLIQGTMVSRLAVPSLPVTLGGLVTLSGLAYVVTNSKSVGFANYDIGLALNDPVAEVFSARSLVALGCFVIASLFLNVTRGGRNVYATGGNPTASRKVGLPVRRITIAVLCVSGGLAALSGALVAYSLAAASPENASNPLLPAAIAAVLGGVGVNGGTGSPLGILAGALTLSVVETTFDVLAAPDYLSGICYGLLLLGAMIVAAPERERAWYAVRSSTALMRRSPGRHD